MNHPIAAHLRLPAAVVACAALLASDSPRFAPQEGSTVEKVFRSSTELDVVTGWMREGDREQELPPGFELRTSQRTELEVSDVYVAVSGGRATELHRSFDRVERRCSAESTRPGGGESDEARSDAESALDGVEVVFRWDREAGAHACTTEDDVDEELLAELFEDLDLRALLPEGDVEVGDTWEVPVGALEPLLAPGGDLAWSFGEVDEGQEIEMVAILAGARAAGFVGAELEGACNATLEEVDGDLAKIALQLELRGERDGLPAVFREFAGPIDGSEFSEEIQALELDLALDGEGTLAWNLAAGRFESLEVTADLAVTLEVEFEENGEPGQLELEFEGVTTLQATAGLDAD